MLHKADDRLKSQVEQLLSCRGIRPPCKVSVSVRNGVVTLSGTVQYAHQKHTVVHACRASSGVRQVIDNLQVPPPKPAWGTNQQHTSHPTPQPKRTEAPAESQPLDAK
jgi:hypothetical protein